MRGLMRQKDVASDILFVKNEFFFNYMQDEIPFIFNQLHE